MKTMYVYVAVAAAMAVLVGGIMLPSHLPSGASVEKRAQYQQNGLNQNPTQNMQKTPNTDSDKGTNENGFGDGDGD